jgi:peroxiredoxin
MALFTQHWNFNKRKSILLNLLGITVSIILTVVVAYAISVRYSKYKIIVSDYDGSQVVMNISELKENTNFLDVKTEKPIRIQLTNKQSHKLLIFFSPADCPSCIDEISIWETLANSYKSSILEVIGILVRTNLEESKAFEKAYNPSFSLFWDKDQHIENYVQLPEKTPFKVVLGPDGNVVLADGPNSILEGQKEFGSKVKSLLQVSQISKDR